MTPWGFEPQRFPTGITAVHKSGGSKSGNKGVGFGSPTAPATPATGTPPADLGLAVVVAAWPDMPEALRAGITAMVKAALLLSPPAAPTSLSRPIGRAVNPAT
jgi:hypothetical protein